MDDAHPIPEGVRGLLGSSVDTIEKLEILLLLRKHPDSRWTETSLGDKLRWPRAITAEAAAGLRRSALLQAKGDSLAYAPQDDELAAAVEELARFYESDRAALLSWMNRNALARIRRAAADAFSDAFRLKPRDKPGGNDA